MDNILFNSDGSINKEGTHLNQYIMQGENSKQIEVKVEDIEAPGQLVAELVCTLPNSQTVLCVGTWSTERKAWIITLTDDITLYNGIVLAALRIRDQATGTVRVMFPFSLVINETGVKPEDDTGVTLEELDGFLDLFKGWIEEAVDEAFDNYNLENGTGTNAVRQKMADATVDFTGRNPNAEALDPTLATEIPTGASGNQSAAFNKNTMALGTASFANGNKTVAKGEESHAEGYQSVTLGDGSHAEGAQTVAKGIQSHSEGALTQALGDESHAEGHNTIAGALASHSEGAGTKVGNYSQESGIGADHTVSPIPGPSPTPTPPTYIAQPGEGSHVEGYDNIVTGYGSHAEGVRNYVTGNYSHAEGVNNSLLKNYAHVSGYNNISNADCSETSGIWNTNNGYGSFVTGFYNESSYNHQAIVGKFNLNKSDTLFEVGNGTTNNARSNAFEVHQDGRATIGAAPTNDMDVVNKKYFEDNLKTINGQPVVGSGNIQISPTQTGLWVHDMVLTNTTTHTGTHIRVINADSTPFSITNMNKFSDLMGSCLQVIIEEGGGANQMALVTKSIYTAGTGSFTLVLTVAGTTYHTVTLSDIDSVFADQPYPYN